MTKKVLIAEDSQTVQKVIGFTLEHEPFELVNCADEKSLFSKLEKTGFDLVALDMSLSEKKSGYDLAREIKLRFPKVSVLALFGTFDVIDEKAFKNSGADEKIVKPFDSTEFVSKCKKLTKISEKIQAKEPELPPLESATEEWKLEAPISEVSEKPEEVVFDFDTWGMDIPGVIETPSIPDESLLEDGAKLLDTINKTQELEEEEELWPEQEFEEKNLEFPEIVGKSLAKSFKDEESYEPEEPKEESFKFETALDEEITSEEFWAIDDEAPPPSMSTSPKSKPKVSHPKEDQNLVLELTESLKPFIEEQIRKYCKQIAEKVAWEVIPDLAENLIKKEIKEISKSLD